MNYWNRISSEQRMKEKFILVGFTKLDVKDTCHFLWSLQKGFEKVF